MQSDNYIYNKANYKSTCIVISNTNKKTKYSEIASILHSNDNKLNKPKDYYSKNQPISITYHQNHSNAQHNFKNISLRKTKEKEKIGQIVKIKLDQINYHLNWWQ